ncbi:hypothetical protein [Natronosalvus rutilus]|uniref:Uncharacterized protein n=1 Tax=Natronosalvus rutilus TaxID=2953753 RepID=A0A9E7NDE1_9EURY|nr:hypothetical protein [Natronosalvus rutilus]UTF55830.1 hypothetical protein NGM29_20315 [Natronosalvus rutilus]
MTEPFDTDIEARLDALEAAEADRRRVGLALIDRDDEHGWHWVNRPRGVDTFTDLEEPPSVVVSLAAAWQFEIDDDTLEVVAARAIEPDGDPGARWTIAPDGEIEPGDSLRDWNPTAVRPVDDGGEPADHQADLDPETLEITGVRLIDDDGIPGEPIDHPAVGSVVGGDPAEDEADVDTRERAADLES